LSTLIDLFGRIRAKLESFLEILYARKMSQSPGVIILAAGLGKRMRSPLPKVLHEIGGKPLLFHIISQVKAVTPASPVAIVVGHGREQVEKAIREESEFSSLNMSFIHQDQQNGTGHAARCVMDSPWGEKRIRSKENVLIVPGDIPLITPALIAQMIAPLGKTEALRLLTCTQKDPTGYGRIVRRGKTGPVLRITEEKDANSREKIIDEVNTSVYLFQAAFLKYGLQKLSNKNAQSEFYLTDLIAQSTRAKKKVDVLHWGSPEDVRGVNDPWELALAGKILNERCIREWCLKGVKFSNPWTAWVDVQVVLEEDAKIGGGVVLCGRTSVAKGAVVGTRSVLKNVTVGAGAHVKVGTVAEDSAIEEGAMVGPYAHLRPGSRVGKNSKIGNFVELKKATIGERTSIAHLSYVGDAEVGNDVNIGCGFVTCNFDGRVIEGQRKHKTVIEDGVFLGSDCQTIAPVRVGKGAYVASGSTITENVEPGALAIARARQVNKPGYAKKLRDKG
jgi:bifunctional UDP-N-acetylglucosamine pyrophosphorylase/glucosamine-1-phosphate N-acetyltransferase